MRSIEPAAPLAEALASIASATLKANGRHISPTLNDICLAVVRAAPLVEGMTLDNIATEIAAMQLVCERLNFQDNSVVVITDERRRVFQEKRGYGEVTS